MHNIRKTYKFFILKAYRFLKTKCATKQDVNRLDGLRPLTSRWLEFVLDENKFQVSSCGPVEFAQEVLRHIF